MKKLARWKKITIGVVALVVLAFIMLFPLNSYIESPGTADDLKSYVSVNNKRDKQSGSFMITSVYLQRARPATYLWALANPHASIEKEDDITGGVSDATYEKVQNFYMKSAINESIATAYKAAGQEYTKKYLGIYVLQITKNSKFKHDIKVGDTVTKVNGHQFDTATGYQKYIGKQKVGTKVTVTYLHNGKEKTSTQPLIKLTTTRSGIGIVLTDNVKVTTKIPVDVEPGQLGGPSGGLMFSLQIYEQLTGQNLRHGQKIAGTGTINPDGSVGEIGGIDKKVIAAKKSGAKIFFAPYVKPTKALLKYEEQHKTNYQLAKATAKKYAPNMKVVPVKTFDDAIKYLQNN